jgi:hypothetical protein
MAIKLFHLALLMPSLLAAGLPAHAENCYILRSARGETLYNSEKPPFDLSYPPFSKEYDAARARGEVLMILSDTDCYNAEKSAERKDLAKLIVWDRANAPLVEYSAEDNQAPRRSAPRPGPAQNSAHAATSAPPPVQAESTPVVVLPSQTPVVVLPPPTPTYFLNSMPPQTAQPAPAPTRSFRTSP